LLVERTGASSVVGTVLGLEGPLLSADFAGIDTLCFGCLLVEADMTVGGDDDAFVGDLYLDVKYFRCRS
jgi:hypothetical protein